MSWSSRLACCVPALMLALLVPPTSADVLGWWIFDGLSSNIVDTSNKGHHGAIRNVPAQADNGNHGFSTDVPGTQMTATAFGTWPNRYSLHLDGTNGYVEITNNITTLSLTNDPSSFTLEMFVKLDTVQSNGERLVHAVETNTLWPYAQIDAWFTSFGTPPRTGCSVMDNQTEEANSVFGTDRTPPVISVGKWHHLAFVKNGANLLQYVDYQVNGSHNWPGWEHAVTDLGQFIIGSTIMAPHNCFDGCIDEVRFSDVALAPADFIHVVRGLPPIMHRIDRPTNEVGLLFSSDTTSVYVVESAPPGPTRGPWSHEATVTGAEFYTSWIPPQTNSLRQYRVQRNLP